MARRRMFSLDVVDTDKFACMSKDARYLYYELGIRADDDGFIGSPMRIIKMIDCTTNDLDELVNNGFVIRFESGIIVIKDWLQSNNVRKDRYKPTIYLSEKNLIMVNDATKEYVVVGNQMTPNGKPNDIPNDNQTETNGKPNEKNELNSIEKESNSNDFGKPNDNTMSYQRVPQDRLGKDRLGKDNNNTYPKDPEDITNLFNDICKSYQPVTDHMKYSKQLSVCIASGYTMNDYRLAFANAERSDYLKGLVENKSFPSNFGWILEHLDDVKKCKYN